MIIPAFGMAAEDFSLMGLEFPVLRDKAWVLSSESLPSARYPVEIDLEFFVSSEGVVDSFHFRPENKKAYLDMVSASIENIEFYPAIFDGQPISFIVPAKLTFSTKLGQSKLRLELPYDDEKCQKNRALIEEALELNGLVPPGLISFPSYFKYLTDTHSVADYPYALFKVDLDTVGNLIEFYNISGDFDILSDLFSRIVLYAKFSPAIFFGQKINSSLYIIIRLFENIRYPTVIWPTKAGPGISLPNDYLRVESMLYPDSIINPPVPLNIPKGIHRHYTASSSVDSIEVSVMIDKQGKISKFNHLSFVNEATGEINETLLKQLLFRPARDIHGEKVDYWGRLFIKFNIGKNIRIVVKWLPIEAQSIIR